MMTLGPSRSYRGLPPRPLRSTLSLPAQVTDAGHHLPSDPESGSSSSHWRICLLLGLPPSTSRMDRLRVTRDLRLSAGLLFTWEMATFLPSGLTASPPAATSPTPSARTLCDFAFRS